MAQISPLRQRMIEDMKVRNLSLSTQQSYIYAVAKFSRHFQRSPDRLGLEEVRAYQLHLVSQEYSWTHINQVACALRFMYGITLGRREAFERIVSGKEPEKLPQVLNQGEIQHFLAAVLGLRNRVALTTAYAAGLRVGEVARLKITSIDSARMLLHVEAGKGGKDRYAMLSPRLLEVLRTYWRRTKPQSWLFPGQEPGNHVSVGALQSACL
jgi:integrase/recombinase XerD